MSLNEAIKQMNAMFTSSVYGFAKKVYHVPGGVAASRVELNAVVYWDSEEGQNNVRADGRAVNQDRGRAVRSSIVLEMASSINVSDDGRDYFEVIDPVSGEWLRFSVKRILGRDAGMQSVLCVRMVEHQAQAGRRLG